MQRYLRPAGRGSSMDEATLKREDAGVSNIVFLVTLVVMSKEAWLYCIEPFLSDPGKPGVRSLGPDVTD